MTRLGATVLLVVVASGWCVTEASAITVPMARCTDCETTMEPACTNYTTTCERTDSAAILTDDGTLTWQNGGTLQCYNCCPYCYTDTCPQGVPPEMECTTELSVSYTEEFSSSLMAGLTGSTVVIETSLESTITGGVAETYSGSVTCGTENLGACLWANHLARLQYKDGRAAKVDHTYEKHVTTNGEDCELEGGGSQGPVDFYKSCPGNNGSSTGSGSKITTSASCHLVDSGECE